jgi:uncharacterized protein YfeS
MAKRVSTDESAFLTEFDEVTYAVAKEQARRTSTIQQKVRELATWITSQRD